MKKRARRNPALAVIANPGRGAEVLSRRVVELRYQHVEDGKHYRHEFGPGVRCFLLRDGSVLLRSESGKPLWGEFEQ